MAYLAAHWLAIVLITLGMGVMETLMFFAIIPAFFAASEGSKKGAVGVGVAFFLNLLFAGGFSIGSVVSVIAIIAVLIQFAKS